MLKICFHTSAFLLLSGILLSHATPALAVSKVTFLGADPEFVTPSPVGIADLAGGGIDAAGNGYFADAKAGSIVKVTPDGSVRTLLSGLDHPRLAVDYRGDVFVSDTGNNRVLSLAAGTTKPAVRAKLPAPGSIVADVSDDFFFLSGSALYEVIRGGEARKIGEFSGAVLLAYGPASGEDDTIYVLSTVSLPGQAGDAVVGSGAGIRYSVATYTYHNTVGTIATGRTFQATDSITDFGLDAEGNFIFAGVGSIAGGQSRTRLFELTTAGDLLGLTNPIVGSNIHLALDYNRTIYYADAQGVFKLMKGAVDFGSNSEAGGSGTPTTLVLNFLLPEGVEVASTSYTIDGAASEDFGDGFPLQNGCSAGSSQCSLAVSYLPFDLGVTAATMSLLDSSGKTVAQVRLHGTGIYPMHQILPDNPVATWYAPVSVELKAPSGICNTVGLGPLVTDVRLGSLVTPYSSAVNTTGLGKPETVAHVPAGNTYTTQAAMAGVLVIHPDGTQSRVAQRLAQQPNGVGVDGAGNLYISDHNSIFRFGVDGTEAQIADPSTDDGYESVESLAVDGAGDVYAFFKSGGPEGRGGLLKITPAGVATAVPTEASGAAGLALDSGGGLYFSDGVTRALETQRTDGALVTLLSGLIQPKGVTALYGPLIVDQGTAQLVGPTPSQSAFDFGNVPIGTTATKRFTVFALGNAQTAGDMEFDGTDPEFSGGGYEVEPGGSTTVTITFTPSFPGPRNVQMIDVANDYFSSNPILAYYTVTAVGVEPEKAH